MQQVGFTDVERKLAVLRAVDDAGWLDEQAFDEVLGSWYDKFRVGRWQYFTPARGTEGLLFGYGTGRITVTGRGLALLAAHAGVVVPAQRAA